MRLVIATHNPHKTLEIRSILSGLAGEVEDLTAFPSLVPPEETGASFEENALIKARAAAAALGPAEIVLADDSGLEVDALGGAPGIHSARYAGAGASDADNREKLLSEMRAASARGRARSGRFRCVMAIARGGNILAICEGAVEGTIANRAKGSGGFGYDPLFIPEGHCRTFGELPEAVKNALSHRGRALEKAKQILARLAAQ